MRAVEERNETVVLCRDGVEVAEIRRRPARRTLRNLTPNPRLRVELAPRWDPTEPLSRDEWPDVEMNVVLDTCAALSLADGTLPRRAAATLRERAKRGCRW